MKKLLTILFLFAVIGNLSADISVKSFRKLENDLDARVNEPLKDFSGDISAIIKVVTTETGFTFDCGQVGIVKTVNKPSEIWVYVPYGVKRITIMHPKLGQLRDWFFTQPIEKATVYEMKLTTGKVVTTVEETIESQWLVITPEPADAAVYIDNLFVKTGTYQTKMKPGSYTYRVEAPLYHTEAGKVEVSDIKKELNVKLKPAFGYVTVTTESEKDAKVIIDGKTLTNNSPCTSEALASGEHTVQVIKEMYQPSAQKVMVTDGQTIPVNFTLQPNFAEITITAPTDATLYVNNQQKATGTWSGRLNAGIYSLEARSDKHRNAKQDIELTAGDKKTIDLQPTPIYGSLDVITTPVGASISINGKDYGTTPLTIKNILIGNYMIKLCKTGYANLNKSITINDGKSSEINEIFASGRAVIINSTPTGANLFIDGVASGETPFGGNLTFGKHKFKIEKDGKMADKIINFDTNNSETNFNINFEPTDIDGNIYHTVTIGTQTWMVENLKVTHYRNGDRIPNVTDNGSWIKLNTGTWCNYNNDSVNGNIYGKLYNWYVVNDKRGIAPSGWRIPTAVEWEILSDYLSKEGNVVSKLKDVGTKHWVKSRYQVSTTTIGTNITGFTALPGGQRTQHGSFVSLGEYCGWWSSTEDNTNNNNVSALSRSIDNRNASMIKHNDYFQCGMSIRCIKDVEIQTFKETVNTINFDMVIVKGGSFNMGSNNDVSNEQPLHSVTLSDYAISKTEVTQALWKVVMENNPSHFKGDNLPVEKVSWVSCQKFISKLNQITGKTYRLPTEAEWEYAARGGNKRRWYNYSGSNNLDEVAWFADNSGGKLHDVGTKIPNELGIYDMSGNVSEWCSDWYGLYSSNSQTNPTGASSSTSDRMLSTPSNDISYMDRVMRDGSYYSDASSCRLSKRSHVIPATLLGRPNSGIGFRLALSLK